MRYLLLSQLSFGILPSSRPISKGKGDEFQVAFGVEMCRKGNINSVIINIVIIIFITLMNGD